MEISDVRRRVRGAIDSARRAAEERRARSAQAANHYEAFLRTTAVPVFQIVAAALIAEGHRFRVSTPVDSVRLESDASPEDFIELALDMTLDPPEAVGRTSRGRGRRQLMSERPIKEHTAVADLSEEDVLSFLVAELVPFVER
jgi:hypothetical protein